MCHARYTSTYKRHDAVAVAIACKMKVYEIEKGCKIRQLHQMYAPEDESGHGLHDKQNSNESTRF